MPAVHLKGEYNLTFVHIPKTAGSSIGKWLEEHKGNSEFKHWYDHPTLETLRSNGASDFTFTVVRNPWERMVSTYTFLQNPVSVSPQYSSQDFRWVVKQAYKDHDWSTFDKWLDIADKFPVIPGWWFAPGEKQTAWVDKDVHVLRYENLAEDFKQVQEHFKSNAPLPNILVGDHNHYKDYYTDSSRNKVAKMYEEEINSWGYTF